MIRSIPDIQVTDQATRDALEAMKEIIEVMLGRRGSDPNDHVLTRGDSSTIVALFEALNTGLSHDTLADVSADDHHPQAHNVASHTDTSVTGAELDADHSKLTGIEANAKDDQIASEVTNTPAGNIAATNVQAAIDELDTEKEGTATSHAARHVTGGGDTIADVIAAGNAGLMTGADKTNLNTLTDNSIADALHRHSELVASDGSPDPALSVAANGNIDTNGIQFNINALGSGDRNAHINLIGDDAYVDYGLRLIRYGGANAQSQIRHRGTGSFFLATQEASPILLQTNGTNTRLTVAADGKVSLMSGTGISEFSTDGTLAGDSDDAVPTEKAVKTYVDNIVVFKSFTVTTQGLGASPDVYAAGFYEAPAVDADLTQANLAQTLGTANKAEAAHAFLVASGVGVTDGSDLIVTVSGISITDAGVRNAADSEVIVADATVMSVNEYFETTKKWLGQVTYTLSSTGGTAYSATFNYGFAKYDDCGNRDFTVTDFEVVGLAGANDNDLDIILFHHHSTGWTYNAAAFVPGGTKICQMSTDHSTDDQLVSSEHFAYKRVSLNTSITGSGTEGVIALITSSANNAAEYANIHIGVTL